MKFFDFELKTMNNPVFSSREVENIFYQEENILEQIAFWIKRGYLMRIKKGVYVLTKKKTEIDPLVLANKLYSLSYLCL